MGDLPYLCFGSSSLELYHIRFQWHIFTEHCYGQTVTNDVYLGIAPELLFRENLLQFMPRSDFCIHLVTLYEDFQLPQRLFNCVTTCSRNLTIHTEIISRGYFMRKSRVSSFIKAHQFTFIPSKETRKIDSLMNRIYSNFKSPLYSQADIVSSAEYLNFYL